MASKSPNAFTVTAPCRALRPRAVMALRRAQDGFKIAQCTHLFTVFYDASRKQIRTPQMQALLKYLNYVADITDILK